MTEIILKCSTCKWWKQYTDQPQQNKPHLGACRLLPAQKDVIMNETEFCSKHSSIPDPTAEAIMDLTAVLREMFEDEIDPDAEFQRQSDW